MAAMELKADADKKGRQDGNGGDKNDKAGKTERVFDLTAPEWYLNRELTWLEFNRRVFSEACDVRNPLLERLFFLAVIGSNLDEFFMKRIGGLKQQVGANLKLLSIDGRTPQQQIDESYAVIRDLIGRQHNMEQELLGQLARQDIHILKYAQLGEEQRQRMATYFRDNIYPLLTPQGMDPAHPFPFISNLSLNLLVATRHSEGEHVYLNRIKVPTTGAGIPRFIRVEPDRHVYVLFEDVIANNLEVIFPGMVIESCELFRVTRNAITEKLPDQAVDLLGHSMGGNVAMLYAGIRPQRVRRLVNLEGFGLPATRPTSAPKNYAAWLDELKTPQELRPYPSLEAVAQRLRKNNPLLRPEFADWLAPHWARQREDGQWEILGDPAHKRRNPVLYQKDEVLACWAAIAASVLWVEGDRTDVAKWWGNRYPRADFESRLQVVKQLERRVLSPAGHMLHHDQPEALAAHLDAFLA